ncbi:N-acetyltransferase [Sphingomonas ginkgonis]|uniref:N-acetyltransferase n=1 Tax=Sphingomonas ginkgonis TaxID=2315330 RepID=A0A429VAW1_9SPHN|nr:GNAT family N-acetyltransferase [Sphingomonas ginkgonis]RST31086.1 N-acetyltransferase [Sphingomonas ginkgonis]
MQRSAPRLETGRLILREFRRDDLAAYAATLGDAVIMRHLGGQPVSREDSWRKLMMIVGQWPLLGYGYWAVERRDDGRMVGHVGFCDFERAVEPPLAPGPEMGWIFDASVHGEGMAGEACRAALAWIDSTLAPATIPAIINPDNQASIRLAERLGFERRPDAVYHGGPITVFERRRPAAAPVAA